MNTHHVRGAAGLVAVEQVGWEGTPILALHGLGANASHWNAIAKALRPRRFLTIDLRGHGRSEPAAEYHLDAMAADVACLAEALGLTRFVLLGHGAGGAVALEAAKRLENRVDSVVVVGAPGPVPAPEELEETLVSAAGELGARIRKEVRATDPQALRGLAESLRSWSSPPLAVPVRIVAGEGPVPLTRPNDVLAALDER